MASDSSLTERKERWARKMSGKAKPAVRSGSRLPPGQHLTPGFPVLDLGVRPEISLGEWRLEVGGLVQNPQTFSGIWRTKQLTPGHPLSATS